MKYVLLFWASGFESWWVMLSQWLWIMVCYSEPVVVNHGVLCWASGCESWWAIIEFNIRLYDKNSESDYVFLLHQIQNIFFRNIGNQNIFLRKNYTHPPPPPFKLNGRSLTRLREVGGLKWGGGGVIRGGSKITILRQKIVFFPIAEGVAKIFGGFRVKNHGFTPKKSYFFQF